MVGLCWLIDGERGSVGEVFFSHLVGAGWRRREVVFLHRRWCWVSLVRNG